MKHAVMFAYLTAAAIAGPLQPAALVPVARAEGRHTGRVRPPLPWTRPASQSVPAWTLLECMTPADQANVAIRLDLGTASPDAWREARAVEDLWNSGDRPAALARLRAIDKYHDPTDINVGMSWREPIPTISTTDWGPNVRVGNRDSVFEIEFDCHAPFGYLFVVSARDSGTNSVVNVYLSMDKGASWYETYNLAVSQGYINSIGAAINGNKLYVGYTRNPNQSLARVMCFECFTGSQTPFPNDSFYRTMLDAGGGDSIQELAMTSTTDEDHTRIYALGCTKGRYLECGWADSTAADWQEYNTGVSWCDGGLACAYNAFGDSVDKRSLWASWIYERTDTRWNVVVCHIDTAAAHSFAVNPDFEATNTMTSQAAWKDTILVLYVRKNGASRYLSQFTTYGAGDSWYYRALPETLAEREWPDVTGRHGDGFALVARQDTGVDDRDLIYSHSPYSATTWGPPREVSDYEPAQVCSPQIEWISHNVYGCTYVKGDDPPNAYSIWFNRSDWGGVTEGPGLPGTRLTHIAPNPIRRTATISYSLSRKQRMAVSLYDVSGRRLKTLVGGVQTPGRYSLTWDGADDRGRRLSAGIYFVKLETGDARSVKKAVLVR